MASTPQTEQKRPPKRVAVTLTPPAISRIRETSADPDLIDSMAEGHLNGWVSDGEQYKEKREASNAAVVYRRALIRKLGGDPSAKGDPVGKTVRSKVWEQDGAFVFALSHR